MFAYSLILCTLAIESATSFTPVSPFHVGKHLGLSPLTRYAKFVSDGTAPKDIVALQKINEYEVSKPLTLADITATCNNRAVLGQPTYLAGEIQLEELEEDTSTLTALKLLPDGRVDFRTTDGPLPLNIEGEWASDGEEFYMVLTRTFEVNGSFQSGPDLEGVTYQLTRSYKGSVDIHPAYKVAEGTLQVADYTIGYFKLIVLPDDVDKPSDQLDMRHVE